MRVNCNISAIIANNQLTKSQTKLDKALERLSSGYKINSAEDDAAGMAISNKLKTQLKGLDRAEKNTTNGISVVQTAESALSEVGSILQRMRELAVQAANDTNDSDDRETIKNEMDQLTAEIDRISSSTEFNTMPLLDGTLGRRAYADVDGVSFISLTSDIREDVYSFTIDSDATQGTADININAAAITEKGTIKINGATIEILETDTIDQINQKITQTCDSVGITYDKAANTLTTNAYGITQSIKYEISDSLAGAVSIQNVRDGQDAQITLGNGFANTATVICSGEYATISDIDGFEMVIELTPGLVNANGGPVDVNTDVTSMGTMTVQLGANEGQVLEVDIPNLSVHALGLDHLYLGSHESSGNAVDAIDKAMDRVSSVRAALGAYQNRLESSVSHLAAYTLDMTSALSAIKDTDMAEEMTEFTQQNVISQAATSMLAQANERPQSVLQLLQ